VFLEDATKSLKTGKLTIRQDSSRRVSVIDSQSSLALLSLRLGHSEMVVKIIGLKILCSSEQMEMTSRTFLNLSRVQLCPIRRLMSQ
jgi:hypothetical protein